MLHRVFLPTFLHVDILYIFDEQALLLVLKNVLLEWKSDCLAIREPDPHYKEIKETVEGCS